MKSLNRLSIAAEVQRELLAEARRAAENAYAPYSGFPVGAAALAADGSIHTGCNVENASYGLSICAERAAVSASIAAGHREIIAVAVAAPKSPLTTPCGACRQVLSEFRPAESDIVIVLDDRGSGDALWLAELLPRSFGSGDLNAAPVPHAETVSTRGNHGR